jgi:flagellin-like protein
MQQIFPCPKCGMTVICGQRVCYNCGVHLNWPAPQIAPSDVSENVTVSVGTNKTPPTPTPLVGYDFASLYQQQGRYGSRRPEPRKKASPVGTALLLIALIVVLAIGGFALASNGAIFNFMSPPVIKSFEVDPATIAQGKQATLQWNVSGATGVSINNGIGNVSFRGTRTVSPTATTTYTLTAINDAGASNSSATVTITMPNPPAINTFAANASTITAGQSSTLQWITTGATSVSIDNGIGIVSPSGTQAVSPTATTNYVITATNSGGSSTQTTTVTVTPAPSPVITSFTATPLSITSGQSSTLQWNTTGATSVSINQGIGIVSPSGSQAVSPAVTTTYIITATNVSGSVTGSATVTVTGTPAITSFTASPSTITAGQSSTLQWTVTGATTVSIAPAPGTVTATTGTQSVTPTATTVYTLTATNSSGSVTATATVAVGSSNLPVVTGFTASPSSIASGQYSTLQWTVTGATTVSISPTPGAVSATTGTQSVSPATTTVYTLTATNSYGTIAATATVTVGSAGQPAINSFTASPGTITAGQSSVLQWAVTGATSVSISPVPGIVSSTTGTQSVSPTTSTVYTLTATNSSGTVTASATVTIGSTALPVINSFTASPPTISYGQSTNLIWSVTGATSLTIDQGVGTFTFGNQKQVTPITTTTYTATATTSAGSVTAFVTVTVQ